MFRSIKQLHGRKLGASDGEIGHVKDFYFDDQSWAVRYVVVDTGSWLPGRKVLISPHAFGNLHQDGNALRVNLTREQIETSPPIYAHEPVSRQYEVAYFQHYGWPSYWGGSELGGVGLFPMASRVPHDTSLPVGSGGENVGDPHLRSAHAVMGYSVQGHDGEVGSVADFMMDGESWLISLIVVETGHWMAGKKIALPTSQVDRISYDESKVSVGVAKETIEQTPAYHIPPLGAEYCDTHGFEQNC